LIKYIKSVLWRVAKRLSYIEDARCLKVKYISGVHVVLQYDRFHTHIQEKEQLFVFLEHAAYQVCIRCFYR